MATVVILDHMTVVGGVSDEHHAAVVVDLHEEANPSVKYRLDFEVEGFTVDEGLGAAMDTADLEFPA